MSNEEMMNSELMGMAELHIQQILSQAIQHQEKQRAVVVYDRQSPLAGILAAAYRHCLPSAMYIDFNSVTAEDIIKTFAELNAGDLVVLVQSTNFRLNAFRIRVELFERRLKVIEHPHLGRMLGEEVNYYVDALAYDANYYRSVGHALKKLIDSAHRGVVDSEGEQLIFASPFELAKLNVGDYTGMKNIGGQFPIGEVFTEAQDLELVSGRVRIFAFGDTTFSVNRVSKPITLVIDKGRVIDTVDATPEFNQVLANIQADEGEVWVRELGFGLNRTFTREKWVTDIGTYERMCGIHLSLGAKHSVYKKPNFKRSYAWHHVDVFAVTHQVFLDETLVYEHGSWVV